LFSILIASSSTLAPQSSQEEIVRSYLKARNAYDIEKVKALINDGYKETFLDGSLEIANKGYLIDMILYGKELDSQMKLLKIRAEGNTVVTTERNSNYMDIALKRKPRTFQITYRFHEQQIAEQIIDTVPGYYKVARHNLKRYEEFKLFCEENDLDYRLSGFDQKNGARLRKVLEQYKKAHK
jgi:hypothetical protein